jgi:hypothetical protein
MLQNIVPLCKMRPMVAFATALVVAVTVTVAFALLAVASVCVLQKQAVPVIEGYAGNLAEPTSIIEYDFNNVDMVGGRKVDMSKFVCGPNEICAYTEVGCTVRTLDEYAVFVMCDAKTIPTAPFHAVIDYVQESVRCKFVDTTHCGCMVRARVSHGLITLGRDLWTGLEASTKTGIVVLAKLTFVVVHHSDKQETLSPIKIIKFGTVGTESMKGTPRDTASVSCDANYDPYMHPLYVYPKAQEDAGYAQIHCFGPLKMLKRNDFFDVHIHANTHRDPVTEGVLRNTYDVNVLKYVKLADGPCTETQSNIVDEKLGTINVRFKQDKSYKGEVNQCLICTLQFQLISDDVNKVHDNVFGCGVVEGSDLTSEPLYKVDQEAWHYGVLDGLAHSTGAESGNTTVSNGKKGLSIVQLIKANHDQIGPSLNIDLVGGSLMYTTTSTVEPTLLGEKTLISPPATETAGPGPDTSTPPPAGPGPETPPPGPDTTPPPGPDSTTPPPAGPDTTTPPPPGPDSTTPPPPGPDKTTPPPPGPDTPTPPPPGPETPVLLPQVPTSYSGGGNYLGSGNVVEKFTYTFGSFPTSLFFALVTAILIIGAFYLEYKGDNKYITGIIKFLRERTGATASVT